MTPYSAITTAAYLVVAVELFVPEQADQFMVGHAEASYYDALMGQACGLPIPQADHLARRALHR